MSMGNDMALIAEKLMDVYGAAFVRGRNQGYETGVHEGYNRGYEEGNVNGYTAGKEHGALECAGKHFTASILGNGTRRFSVPIPFKPQLIAVFSINPYSGAVANSFKGFLIDWRAFGGHAGNVLYSITKDTVSTALIVPTAVDRFAGYADGVFHFELPPEMYPDMIWPVNARYTVTAMQWPEESMAAHIREQIRLLPDAVPSGSSGTLKYYRNMVLQHISLPEWEALTAEKPNWTFLLE